MRATYFLLALSGFFVALLSFVVFYYLRRRIRTEKNPYGSWEELLGRLSAVNREKVTFIALSLVDEFGQRRRNENDTNLDESQIWSLIGGLKGLEALERDCALLVDLVFYVQQWYPEALAIAEQLRLNTREIEWHIARLKSAAKLGKAERAFPEHAEQVVVIYYTMTRRVLALYEEWNLPGLVELRRSL
jgi:hypothetical protein